MSGALLRSIRRLAKEKSESYGGKFRWVNGGRRSDRSGRSLKVISGLAAGCCGLILYALDKAVEAAEARARLPSYPWESRRAFKSLDHAAVRRGWLVYKTVCRSCHSLEYLRFAEMVDVSHTQSEVKAIAAEFEIQDGPDEDGNYYMRPARLSDRLPPPFPNEEAARAANLGSYPPDLSYIVSARKNGLNYIFSLLTGYMDPPAGVTLDDGQYFNPYFAGGKISMGQILNDGAVEYEDGTPATVSQMAKDVLEFLTWTSAQEHDGRKVLFIRFLSVSVIFGLAIFHLHRRVGSFHRSRQIAFVPKRKW